ncbi:MAG: hypothetical protein HY366_00155, partial [Candidatus Aenigmarchaeota archaeon]|nr:hypothetical protein [Candidatus Aenigmarchaeota archaeon]
PDGRYSKVGGRACRRSEQVATQPATPRILDNDAVAELKQYRSQIDEIGKGIDDIFKRYGV